MGNKASENVIYVDGVKKYFGNIKAVNGVSLGVDRGTIYGLLGPNGAGKTTLIKMMTTLLLPDTGDILIDGHNVVNDPYSVRRIIGLAGQYAAVDEFQTGEENLVMVGSLYHLSKAEAVKSAKNALRRFGLSDAKGRPVSTYSGGMRRRLDLAASLVARPDILFLDEPTTGLDPRTRMDLWSLIKELVADGVTILLTTQYLEEADELADMIGVIDKGKLVAEGTPDELKTSLGSDLVEFMVDPNAWSEGIAKKIEKAVGSKVEFDETTGVAKVKVKRGAVSMIKIVRILDENKIVPKEFALHRPSLDDVFLNVTGNKKPKRRSK